MRCIKVKPSSQKLLEETFQRYHHPKFLGSDPLEFPRHYENPLDQEAIALVSALLAYGRVSQIQVSLRKLIQMIEAGSKRPSEFVRSLENQRKAEYAHRRFSNFKHRFNTGRDVILLLRLLSKSWSQYGSLGAHFLENLAESDEHIGGALSILIEQWKNEAKLMDPNLSESFYYFLTSPTDGSCCKRWCMLLRWMGRKDDLDLGLWTEGSELLKSRKGRGSVSLEPRQLVIPLDTHTGRLSKSLKLRKRKSLDWKSALEVTESLRELDPGDPIKYDFSLARIGILKNKG